ncbi:hypothetical protein [Burkholderia cenocepacia]|uniref:hypothetical protein n=1 Tax=Burkholderia cenocepacia TaxID=95486 RepID=UPI002018DF67|nr:hypothetical protein [Burkholderia cenocepacia]MCO1396399.1 hypothetical protein [Burkholderia cenocepacia]MCO1408973.1 hypothetical protein [Burkholderia cenocepacia]UQN92052.1 hypothetical protein L0Z06_15130 [Burkholderia cenocepacia]UQN99201.1 hypothetical protein L0Z39_16920 [Burkholderia cenocepacia]UQP50844.1 hypothetical protein L0Y99_10325 [Burkholderia cenocepacia]
MQLLEDLKGMDASALRQHFIESYEAAPEQIDRFEVLLGYESVGSWGCDSSSYFLLRLREDSSLFEVRGSHCSCHGFEGQFEPEPVSLAYLSSDKHWISTGGYDSNADDNEKTIRAFIASLAAVGDSDGGECD